MCGLTAPDTHWGPLSLDHGRKVLDEDAYNTMKILGLSQQKKLQNSVPVRISSSGARDQLQAISWGCRTSVLLRYGPLAPLPMSLRSCSLQYGSEDQKAQYAAHG